MAYAKTERRMRMMSGNAMGGGRDARMPEGWGFGIRGYGVRIASSA